MTVRIKRLSPEAQLPEYAHGPAEDAGMDLRATEPVVLQPGLPVAVPTGLALELPAGYEAQIRPRSGLALKHGITVPNAPATIDPGYRGELKVILLNLGREAYQVQTGDKIAQMVIAKYEAIEWHESDLADSARGTGGFGSSGRCRRLFVKTAELAVEAARQRLGLAGILVANLRPIRHRDGRR